MDKFVAESSRSKFTHRLLIATTDKRHHIATCLMDDLGIPFIGLTQMREALRRNNSQLTAATTCAVSATRVQ